MCCVGILLNFHIRRRLSCYAGLFPCKDTTGLKVSLSGFYLACPVTHCSAPLHEGKGAGV